MKKLLLLSLLIASMCSAQLTHFKAVAWTSTVGFTAQATTDVDGGLEATTNAAFNYGNYMIYPVNGGSMTFRFRVKTTAGDCVIKMVENGTELQQVPLPNTGGAYQTVTTTQSLTAGPHTILIQQFAGSTFVINWIEFTDYSFLTPKVGTIDSNIGGYWESLPTDYGTSSTNYPLIIFTHGIGEEGNGNTGLGKILTNNGSIPNLISAGTFPTSFTVGSNTYRFIVIMPQMAAWHQQSTDVQEIQDMIDYAKANYRVNANKIYLVGVSMGGGELWDYVGTTGKASQIAAAVTMAGAADSTHAGALNIAGANLPVWSFHNNQDGTVPPAYTDDWITAINSHSPTPLARKTVFFQSPGVHDCWTQSSDPTYTENVSGIGTVNIYQWMLSYSRSTAAAPSANAGVDQTITTFSVGLSGSGTAASGQAITTYLWSKVSGTGGSFTSASAQNTSVTGLGVGIYVFRLTVTQTDNQTGTDDIQITVNAAPSGGHTLKTCHCIELYRQ